MQNKLLRNPHPGIILFEEFLKPMGITAYFLSKSINVPQNRISEIIKGHRIVTTDTAIRLGKFFGTSAQFWLGLQNDYDIMEAKRKLKKDYNKIKQIQNVLNKEQ
jgi:antitoxin HigA-1